MKHKLIITLALLFGGLLNHGLPMVYSAALLEARQPKMYVTATPVKIIKEIVVTSTPLLTRTPQPTRTLRLTRTAIHTPLPFPTIAVPTLTPRPTTIIELQYPSDITAICKDGTYSYSKHVSGTCSRHDGVKMWVNKPSK